ncbi:hypothetical protein R1sor_019508 [Riccia sorocarpa]|uniref:Uncharacterized protein n=1 Tax=Riccia sorocarpa TaxID=122646 RepID=A0ABD3IGW5_9MARC
MVRGRTIRLEAIHCSDLSASEVGPSTGVYSMVLLATRRPRCILGRLVYYIKNFKMDPEDDPENRLDFAELMVQSLRREVLAVRGHLEGDTPERYMETFVAIPLTWIFIHLGLVCRGGPLAKVVEKKKEETLQKVEKKKTENTEEKKADDPTLEKEKNASKVTSLPPVVSTMAIEKVPRWAAIAIPYNYNELRNAFSDYNEHKWAAGKLNI